MEREEARKNNLEALEARVAELENIADSLGEVPDEELLDALGRAVGLLREVNADIEKRVRSAGNDTRELGTLLDGAGFGAFDEALDDIERRERGAPDAR